MSAAFPQVPLIHSWASPGEETAATGAPAVRRTGDSPPSSEIPCSGLSAAPWRSSQRPSQPGEVFSLIRPVSQKWREWKCERSGLA